MSILMDLNPPICPLSQKLSLVTLVISGDLSQVSSLPSSKLVLHMLETHRFVKLNALTYLASYFLYDFNHFIYIHFYRITRDRK